MSNQIKVRGRPRKTAHVQDLKLMQTRVPQSADIGLKYQFIKGRYKTKIEQYDDMLNQFLLSEPWLKNGFVWRKPLSVNRMNKGNVGKTGWKLENILMSKDMSERIKLQVSVADVSLSTFLYTAIFWWLTVRHQDIFKQANS